MNAGSVPLLYNPAHQLHAPQVEFDQGRSVPFRDDPARAGEVYQRLMALGLGKPVRSEGGASVDDLFQVHSLQMLDFLEAVSTTIQVAGRYLYPEFFPVREIGTSKPKSLAGRLGYYATDAFSPIGPDTWKAACASAGLARQGAELLLHRAANCAYALTRPPGNHAGPDFFGSCCYLNNAALAASRLLSLGQVAVLDIDYHHGNGTQSIFWEEPRVLYASLHIDPNRDFPYFSGYSHETGGSQAPGSTYNIPLPPGTTSNSYLQALDVLLQTIRAFKPAALVVSAGLNAYQGDPFSAFRVEAGVYLAIGGRIAALGLPTLFVQEGGYDLETLPLLVENLLTGFLGGQVNG